MVKMAESKRDAYAFKYATQKARTVFKKLPAPTRAVNSVEDISQNLCLHYLRVKNKYDTSKGFKVWLHTVMKNHSTDTVYKLCDTYRYQQTAFDGTVEIGIQPTSEEDQDDGITEFENVVLDINTPELLCFSYYEELEMAKKIEIFITEVESLCKRFNVPFKISEYNQSFLQVLDKTLNKMSDAEFRLIPYATREKLAKYGEAITADNLTISPNGKMRNFGITATIRKYVLAGLLEIDEVTAELKKEGLSFPEGSVRALLWKEKKRAGLDIRERRNGVLEFVETAFDYGRGATTVAEMAAELTAVSMQFSPATLRSYMQRLRANHGLTKKRKNRRLTKTNRMRW